MTRKIIFIIIGALLFLVLLALLWFWFLKREPAEAPVNPSGFATSSDRTADTETPTDTSNGYDVLAGVTDYEISGDLLSGLYQVGNAGEFEIERVSAGRYRVSSRGGSKLPSGRYTFTPITVPALTPIGSIATSTNVATGTPISGGINSGAWIGNNSTAREFNATEINQLNNTSGLSGTPRVAFTPQPSSLSTSGLVLGITAAGCLAQWALNQVTGIATTVADPVTAASVVATVPVTDYKAATQREAQKANSVWQCLVKSIAKAAIDQITRSVVAWINSGFNGQPSFVTNFNQYFANVADQAAGEFIKGSALSFLCSPFAPQIKIAIAQSYASRNNAASCSLSKITNNINGFMRGSFGAGGWSSLIQFTTIPTNNPYGAYAYAQVGLSGSIANAQNNANRNVSPGGFIALQDCKGVVSVTSGTGQVKANPNCKITTPGTVIEQSLKKTLVDTPIDGLNLAQNINDIISALANQVMIKALYGGLGSATGGGITNPLAPAIDQQASAQAQNLLSQLQSGLGYAGQYGNVMQGSISDIQNSQAGLNAAYNCWSTLATSTTNTSLQAQANSKASEANTAQVALEARIGTYNREIMRANEAMATIQNMQSQVLLAASPEDVRSAASLISQGNSLGAFLSQGDVTTAQQNRSTLQAELTTRNQQTAADLAQCRATKP